MKTVAVTDLFCPILGDKEMLTHMYETTSKLPTEVCYVCTVVHQSSFPSVQWKRLCVVRTRTCSLRSDRAELLKHVKGLKNTCLSHVQKNNSNEWKMLTSLSNLTSCFFFTVSSRKHIDQMFIMKIKCPLTLYWKRQKLLSLFFFFAVFSFIAPHPNHHSLSHSAISEPSPFLFPATLPKTVMHAG